MLINLQLANQLYTVQLPSMVQTDILMRWNGATIATELRAQYLCRCEFCWRGDWWWRWRWCVLSFLLTLLSSPRALLTLLSSPHAADASIKSMGKIELNSLHRRRRRHQVVGKCCSIVRHGVFDHKRPQQPMNSIQRFSSSEKLKLNKLELKRKKKKRKLSWLWDAVVSYRRFRLFFNQEK